MLRLYNRYNYRGLKDDINDLFYIGQYISLHFVTFQKSSGYCWASFLLVFFLELTLVRPKDKTLCVKQG